MASSKIQRISPLIKTNGVRLYLFHKTDFFDTLVTRHKGESMAIQTALNTIKLTQADIQTLLC